MTRWERRIERAAELEAQYPAAASLMSFYREVAKYQSTLTGEVPVPPDADPEAIEPFRALVRAQAEAQNASVRSGPMKPHCPTCGEKPVASVLRPEGDGGKRFLLCSLCLNEWEFRRVLCPSCGEEDKEKLPVYGAEEYAHIRVEACDTCKTYLKSIDMTRDGLAVPEVDELASLALDLWAIEKGYKKLQPNLFGI